MTEQQAMRLALEALEQYHGYMEPLTTVFGGPRVPAEQSTTSKVEKAITALRQALAEHDSRTLYREGYVNGYAFGEAAGKKQALEQQMRPATRAEKIVKPAVYEVKVEQQDGDCQRCGGKGCVACDARKQQPADEPVAYLDEGLGTFYWSKEYKKDVGFTPLYTRPQPAAKENT